MLIDTHCHLNMLTFSSATALQNAGAAGVGAIICPTAEPKDIEETLPLIEKFDNVFATIGLHPDCANKFPSGAGVLAGRGGLSNPKIVGIGEIGLDYHFNSDNTAAQKKLFIEQIEIAIEQNLPIAIHSRDAENDTFDCVRSYPGARGVMHCFTGSWDFARKMLDLGFYISASGIITFKNANDLRETFLKIPLDRLVVETDAPYLSPMPHRGKECEPAFVAATARALATLRGMSFEELENILFENTMNLYPKLKDAKCHGKL